MFKLVVVGGKLRGKEYILNEGDNNFGRSPDSDHQVALEGISKKHMGITVSGTNVFIQDLGSSNGTFLNGKLVKKGTLKPGDKIALPNVIFQVVFVKEKRVAMAKEDDNSSDQSEELMPNHLPGKIKHIFKHRVMQVLYSFNQQYEWNSMLGILLFIFICLNIAFIIGPVLMTSESLLLKEVALRGKQFADEVARANTVSLARGELDKVDTNFLDNEVEGIKSYELFDLDGRIVRPITKLNSYVNDSFSINTMKFFKGSQNLNSIYATKLNDGDIGIGKAILAHNIKTGRQEPVGIISIRFQPASLREQASQNSSAYLESLVTCGLIAILFFGFIYYLTTKPVREMKDQIEEALRGKRKELESEFLFEELNPLRSVINSILQKNRELQNEDSGEFAEVEEDGSYVRTLNEVMQGANGPVMILNSEKNIQHLNPEAEDLLGIRESASAGDNIMDTARDQGLAATLVGLCDDSANAEGSSHSDDYEITGRNFRIFVTALIGRDNFAKAFYVSFVHDE
jgi:pSer/pThr/pTyr-binding forkhead associated (FHA) protein